MTDGLEPVIPQETLTDPNKEIDRQNLAEYRLHLVEAREKSQDAYDRNVLTLSGAGIGISLTIVKDFIGTQSLLDTNFLFGAWASWALSMIIMVLSYLTSYLTLSEGITEVDHGNIYDPKPRYIIYGNLTVALNFLGGLLLVIGVILIGIFIYQNVR